MRIGKIGTTKNASRPAARRAVSLAHQDAAAFYRPRKPAPAEVTNRAGLALLLDKRPDLRSLALAAILDEATRWGA